MEYSFSGARNRFYISLLFIQFISILSFGQVVERLKNETPELFATRVKPDNSNLTHKVIGTNWNKTPVIITFYDQVFKDPPKADPDQQEYHRIIAILFAKIDSTHYYKYLIDTFGPEGGDPNIESVFFANADNDPLKELIIIVSWEQRHYDFGGTLYDTNIYDDLKVSDKIKLKFLSNMSGKLSGGCECDRRDGTIEKARFKTASDVIDGLKKLGYKQ